MKVLKFGGTSVGTIESLREVKKIVESIPGNAIVVVSALGGLTDKLISTAKRASEQDDNYKSELIGFRKRHLDIIDELVLPEKKPQIQKEVIELLDDLERIYQGVSLIHSLPEQTLDLIVSFGERMSSRIVAGIIKNGKRHDSLNFIKTEKWYGKNIAERKLTEGLIKEEFKSLEEEEKAIIPGFISTDKTSGIITNLGRGGSDYTGALIASALNAEILEIWTDVDGFMTADPRIVKDAIVIDHLTYTESMELCNFGAKVIYPPTIYPVFHKNIPICILNTFNSSAPGTMITDNHQPEDLPIKGVTSLKNLSLISLDINNPVISAEISNRALNILSKEGINLTPVFQPEKPSGLFFAVTSKEAEIAIKLLENEFAPEITSGLLLNPQNKRELAALAVVGVKMKEKTRLAERIAHSLYRENIPLEALSIGNSDTTLIYIINEDRTSQALSLIHSIII